MVRAGEQTDQRTEAGVTNESIDVLEVIGSA